MPSRAPHVDTLSWAPMGLSIDEAARHVGISTAKFAELVEAGQMPKPKRIGTRRVWDRLAVELAFRNLPDEGAENPWNRLRGKQPAA